MTGAFRGAAEGVVSEPDDPSSEAEERRSFACPPGRGLFEGLDLAFLDPADPDERSVLIRAEHPDLAAAIRRGEEEVVVGGVTMNPRLHLTIHEVVANQLWADDPPEVWRTARLLLGLGYERHEILHMIGSAFSSELWQVLAAGEPSDPARYVRALEALPGSRGAARPSRPPHGRHRPKRPKRPKRRRSR